MAEFPSMPLWTDAYLADTRHLSTQEHGAYLLLLMEAWRRPSCSLPDDDKMLSRLTGLREEEWLEIKEIVLDFWRYDSKRKEWSQTRLLKEREYVSNLTEKRRVAAASRWNKTKKDHANAMQSTMQSKCKTDAPTPTPTYKDNNSNELLEKKEKPKRKKATRLPDDWTISDSLKDWIRGKGYGSNFVFSELEKFKNWASGSGATKINWDATFRNWLLNANERKPASKPMTVGQAALFAQQQRGLEIVTDNRMEQQQSIAIASDRPISIPLNATKQKPA